MATAKRHRHVVEVVEEPARPVVVEPVREPVQPVQTVELEHPAEMYSAEVAPGQDMGLLGVNIEQASGGRGMGKLMWVVIIIIVAGMVTGGWLVWQINRDKLAMVGGPTPTPDIQVETSTPSPEVSPTPEIKLEDVKVQVLNGSGIKGQAGKISDLLEQAGFKAIATGNATKFDYEDIEVSYKSDVKSLSKIVEKALDDYTVNEGEALKDTSKYDIVVIVGKKSE